MSDPIDPMTGFSQMALTAAARLRRVGIGKGQLVVWDDYYTSGSVPIRWHTVGGVPIAVLRVRDIKRSKTLAVARLLPRRSRQLK